MSLARLIGSFVSDLTFDELPREVVDMAKLAFIDCMGTIVAGRNEDAVQILERTLDLGLNGDATLYFSNRKASAPIVAWINATAAHVHDYDDVALKFGHPSAVLVPAILAEGEALDRSGPDMIEAYVAGFETWAELARRDKGYHHLKGWHPTGIFGPIASAVACAKLRRLGPSKTSAAVAIASSQSAGLVSNFGSMTKAFQVGRAAHAGILSSRLAEAGLTGNIEALEHPQGLLVAVSPQGEVDRRVDLMCMGREWALMAEGISFKRFPVCYQSHRAIDSALHLQAKQNFAPESIDEICVTIGAGAAKILFEHQPSNSNEAKCSLEFAVTAALLAGKVGFRELSNDFIRRKEIQDTMKKVTTESTDGEVQESLVAPYDQVVVMLKSGAAIEGTKVSHPSGNSKNPMSKEAFQEKFEGCLEFGGIMDRTHALFHMLSDLENMKIRNVVGAFAAASMNSFVPKKVEVATWIPS